MCKKALLKAMLISVLLIFSGKALADEIVIAVAAPLTGPAARAGSAVKKAATIKVNEFNAAGGINGQDVEIVVMDEQCSPKKAVAVAKKIVEDTRILGVVGHVCTRAHLAALATYVKEGVPVISPSVTAGAAISDKASDRKGRVWGFRTSHRDDYYSQSLARYAKEFLNLNRVAVFYSKTGYGKEMRKGFVEEAKKIGLDIVKEKSFKTGAEDFTKDLTKAKKKDAEGLFISGEPAEAALIALQASKLGMDVPKFVDVLDDAKYLNLAKEAAENTFFAMPSLSKKPHWIFANAFDATGILLKAVIEVGPNRKKIREYVASINSKEKSYDGMSGPVYFDEKGDCQRAPWIKTVVNSRFVPAPDQLH
ncbi:MAG: ABC transporter substrate-binding protein [Syntrophobacterales bacterium]